MIISLPPSFFSPLLSCLLTDVESLPEQRCAPPYSCTCLRGAQRRLCVFVDLTLEQGSNLPLRQGERRAYWCFSYKSTSRNPGGDAAPHPKGLVWGYHRQEDCKGEERRRVGGRRGEERRRGGEGMMREER